MIKVTRRIRLRYLCSQRLSACKTEGLAQEEHKQKDADEEIEVDLGKKKKKRLRDVAAYDNGASSDSVRV